MAEQSILFPVFRLFMQAVDIFRSVSVVLVFMVTITALMSSCARENVFEEPPDYPVIDSIQPAVGGVGTQLRIYGSGFSTNTLENTVTINGKRLQLHPPSSPVVLLATIIEDTGTGPVQIAINDKSSEGPIFTYIGDESGPAITNVIQGWNDGRGYAVNVIGISAVDSDIKLFVNGTEVSIDYITRPGHPFYRPENGNQLLIDDHTVVEDHVQVNWADIVVTVRGVDSNVWRYYVAPVVTDVASRFGSYVIAGLEPFTIRGKFFGESSPTSSVNVYSADTPPAEIISWSNTEIVVRAADYRDAEPDWAISVTVWVDDRQSYGSYCTYLGVVNATAVLVAGSDEGFEDGPAAIARFNRPFGVAIDRDQSIFVTEEANHAIRKITPNGIVSTFAGGTAGFVDAVGTRAQFNRPQGIVATGSGHLYVADASNNRIRIMFEGAEVSTAAGNGTPNEYWYPSGVAYSVHEDIVVADMNNHRIKVVSPGGYVSEVIGGSGEGFMDGDRSVARFSNPYGVAITQPDPGGIQFTPIIYVADRGNHRIRKISKGQVQTLAGNDVPGKKDGAGTDAQFDNPTALALDAQGNLYVADFSNSRIRKITPQGVVTTITPEFPNDAGILSLLSPTGIAIDPEGNLVVADYGSHKIYRITLK
jgi:sugar lactone lactonase YvrE